MLTRQIILDTETTGLNPKDGHRIIEIGCVELINRRLTGNNFHYYLNPNREIDAEAVKVHGITNAFLINKPNFYNIAEEFLDYIKNAEIVAHNARFDIGFINHELQLALDVIKKTVQIDKINKIIDTLELAKKLHPGQKNSLDALCRRYNIDNTQRELHGALLDAKILADVYLAMTGGQCKLEFDEHTFSPELGYTHRSGLVLNKSLPEESTEEPVGQMNISVVKADEIEMELHNKFVEKIRKASMNNCVWDLV